MKTVLVVLAVAFGMLVVDCQLFPGLIDDKPGFTDNDRRVPGPPLEVDDPHMRDGRPLHSDSRDNDTDVKKPEGDRYFWSRALGEGENVFEWAFASNGSSVIVVKSRDRTLEERNITRATSVYTFQDSDSIVATIPWGFYGPCLIRNTSLTYPAAINMLEARNGSSFRSTHRLSVDANMTPLSPEEGATFLAANPVLWRWCSSRPIIMTVDIGDNPKPYSNSTEEITTLQLEADISITVPERPDSPDSPQTGDGKSQPQRPSNQGVRWGYSRDLLLDPANHHDKNAA